MPAHRTFVRLALAAAATLLLVAPPASAQSGPVGSLSGTTQDANGAALPGVVVAVRNTDTGQTRAATSDGEGRWTIPALPVGNYEVTYELAGFRRQVRSAAAAGGGPR